jgi:hypothetical protein
MAENSQSLSRPNKFSQRSGPHFLHDVTAMNFDGFFRYAQRVGDLLVKHPRDDTSHHFALARGKRLITPV